MASKEEKKTKVLIQEIGEAQTPMELEGEEQTCQDEQQLHGSKQENDSQQNKAASKDLLRLEKNYFDKVYNSETHGNQKAFVVSKMMVEAPAKPNFKSLPVSSIKDRLNSFLPSFKKDTDDLLVNPERQEAMRIDDRNMYEEEEKNNQESSSDDEDEVDEEEGNEQEKQLRQHQMDLAELRANNKEAHKKNKKENTENNNQEPKVIQLDLLLGVLDVKMPETKDQKE